MLVAAATLRAVLQLVIGTGALPAGSIWANRHFNVPTEQLFIEWIKNAIAYSTSLNSPAWSIQVELVASVLFPLFMRLPTDPTPL